MKNNQFAWTPEMQVLWGQTVEKNRLHFERCDYSEPSVISTIAADAELKRLRGAVEWAINKALEIAAKEDTNMHPMAFAIELRRRAKEGK